MLAIQKSKYLWYTLLLLIATEGACTTGLYFITGEWLFNHRDPVNSLLFEPHPLLTGAPRKNASVVQHGIIISHNEDGLRNSSYSRKRGKFCVVAMGGSTTYGVSVSDNQTWPYYLDSILGNDYRVINMGVPGYSTVENIIQTCFILPEFLPDVVLLHAGLNDLRNMFSGDPAPDYSHFHAPSFFGALGFCYRESLPNIAILHAIVLVMEKTGIYPVCPFHKSKKFLPLEDTGVPNENALRLYKRNLKTFLALCRRWDVKVILLPQILLPESASGNQLKWWIPYVKGENLLRYMDVYNEAMCAVAKDEGVVCLKEALKTGWSVDDFTDPSHFSAKGNLKFARLVSEKLLRLPEFAE